MSTNEAVAKVDNNGNVTAVGTGVTQIKAYSMDKYCYAACEIYVKTDKITSLIADSDNVKVNLKWNKVANAHGYMIYKWNVSTSSWDNIATINKSDALIYTDSNLTAGTQYKYYVTSYLARWDSTGNRYVLESDKGNECAISTDDQMYVKNIDPRIDHISLPVGVSKKIVSRVYPSNAVGGNLKYRIVDNTIAEIKSIENITTVEIKGLKPGSTSLIISDELNKCIVTLPVIITPAYRVDKQEGDTKYNTTTIKWKGIAEEDSIDGYLVTRTTSIEFNTIATISKEDLRNDTYSDKTACYSYTDKDLVFSKTYKYRIVPYVLVDSRVCGCGTGDYISITTPEYVPVKAVVANPVYTVKLGGVVDIQAKASNEDALNKDFIWYLNANGNIVNLTKINADTAKVKGIKTGISSVDIVANDEDCNFITSKIIVLPGKVNNITTNVSSNSVQFKWSAVEGVNGYNVYRYNTNESKWNLIKNTQETNITDTTVKSNSQYIYRVIAYVKDAGVEYKGITSDDIIVKTKESNVITKPVVTATTLDGQIKVSWKAVPGATRYQVCTYVNGKYTIQINNYTGTSYTIIGLVSGTKYGILVRAYGNGAWTSYSTDDLVYVT